MDNNNTCQQYYWILTLQEQEEDYEENKAEILTSLEDLGARDGVRTRDLHIGNVSF